MLEKGCTALVIIDVQGKLAQLMHAREQLFKNLQILIKGVKIFKIPIIWMEQVPEKLGPTVQEIRELLAGQKPIEKDVFSCARNEEFRQRLHQQDIHHTLLSGIETHVCVYQTALDLIDQGYDVEVVADAVASRTDFNKQVGLKRILQAGGSQTSVEMALFELQQTATGDQFRELVKLVK